MFRAKDTICITMQISIIKRWQFIFPGKERKMFSVRQSFGALPMQLEPICCPNWMICHNFMRLKYPVSWFACMVTLQVCGMINGQNTQVA